MIIEYAADNRGHDRTIEAIVARAPAHVRRNINAKRTARGLAPILSRADYQRLDELRAAEAARLADLEQRGPGVWVSGPRGTLMPATSSKPIVARPAARGTSRGPLVTRVLLMVAYGEASAADVRGKLPETILRGAFGSADELNREKGWTLRAGHHGDPLAVAGERLRAHDTPAGLVVEWIPDPRLPWDQDAVRAIEEGRNAVSVGMVIKETRVSRILTPTTLITRARLSHIALLVAGENPCYAGARSKVFRSAWRDDRDELRRHIDETINRARWYSRRAEGW
jgi:hypothetical protein